jgi:prepilin-type N-terminal cleavage/methylation domain-containing protein
MVRTDSNGAANSIRNGFTLMELMIVVLITAILSTLAIPSFLQWRQNLEVRKTTRDLVSILREARSRSIKTNLEHRVEYADTNKQYRMTQGNRSNNSTLWNTVVYEWTELPSGVRVNANVNAIQMNTNGTANGGTIFIQDDALKSMRYGWRVPDGYEYLHLINEEHEQIVLVLLAYKYLTETIIPRKIFTRVLIPNASVGC